MEQAGSTMLTGPRRWQTEHIALSVCSPPDHDIPDNLSAWAKRLLGLPVQLRANSARVPKGDGELILRLPLRLLTWAQQRFLGAT